MTPTETELKLSLTEEGARQLTEHALFHQAVGTQPEQRHLVSTYFDTPDLALAHLGIALRVRRDNGKFIQTLKTEGAPGVAISRGEWEWEVPGDTPDLSLLAGVPAARQLPEDLALRLRPIFHSDVSRTIWNLRLDSGTAAEVALDEGKIVAGVAEEPVRELEMELQEGTPGALYRLALELHAASPLTIGLESKAARGYRLAAAVTPAAEKAREVVLGREVTAAEGFFRITKSALGHLLVNRTAAVAGTEEGIHQMRVAVRRLRAAIVVFRPCLEPQGRAGFEGELRRIGQVFGEARDWDVFCIEVLPRAVETSPAGDWSDVLRHAAEGRRAAAHAAFAKECCGPAFTAVVLGVAGWAAGGAAGPGVLGNEDMRRPLIAVAPALLDVLADKVDKLGRHIARASDVELHALRKSLKKLRYGVEFLGSLFPRKETKHYQERCEALQKVLGLIQDTVMAVELAESLGQGAQLDLAPAVAFLRQSVDRDKRDGLRESGRLLEAIPQSATLLGVRFCVQLLGHE